MGAVVDSVTASKCRGQQKSNKTQEIYLNKEMNHIEFFIFFFYFSLFLVFGHRIVFFKYHFWMLYE